MAFVYRGAGAREVSFPLGGLGTGSIGLAGNGALVDWEIFNRPNKGSRNGPSHFAIRAERDGRVIDARVLQGDLAPPYTGELGGGRYSGFGFGAPRDSLAGLPHFRDVEFTGTYPLARLTFEDQGFPGQVRLEAFNPFIPHNDRDSGIPAAFFEIEARNTTSEQLAYTVVLVARNPLASGARNRYRRDGGLSLLRLDSDAIASGDPAFGDLTIATDCDGVSYQEYLYRGRWFDNLAVYWQDLLKPGPFANRRYSGASSGRKQYSGDDIALLAAHLHVEPGAAATARFVVSWSFPNCTNYWNPEVEGEGCGAASAGGAAGAAECGCGGACRPRTWKNWYATVFRDSTESALYCFGNWKRLARQTREFRDALFGSTLPEPVLDAVSANLSILKSPTVMRLEDGTFYGFEGCHPHEGCCEGSCQHVWNYAYALPFLFPALERSMRDAELRYNLGPGGDMTFRLQLPLGRQRTSFRPCADGQFGAVIKAYREWKISGDTGWLRSHWPQIRSAIAWAWSEANRDRWDRDRDGVLEGRQHHTLDMELFGPNSWLTGFYLAALEAAAQMAEHLGDRDAAAEYRALFERGRGWVDSNLFNGEYYFHKVDIRDRAILAGYPGADEGSGDARDTYWDEEHGEIKYQVAEGCLLDQVLAQWHANIVGLGRVFDAAKTRRALEAVFRHNYKASVRDLANPCRVFALNDEGGAVICSFPRAKPALPVPYAEEMMAGFEYQAACHMIQEGLLDEGLAIVRAVRARYDGAKRNPWNEIECGSNYARSMASYALLLAFSGFRFDMTEASIGFAPLEPAGGAPAGARFSAFWSVQESWGVFQLEGNRARLTVLGGTLALREFSLDRLRGKPSVRVTLGGAAVAHALEGDTLRFAAPVRIERGRPLELRC